MNARLRIAVSAPALACALLTAVPALAQEADSSATKDDSSDIVVTANKRETTLQNLPAAVSAIAGDDLQRMGVKDFRDLATAVPSLTFVPTSDSTTKIVIRGISTGNLNDAASSATGLYLDDVPMSSAYGPGGTQINLVDIERVEVLRGPQGTLYGAGSVGGTVRYVAKRPDLSRIEGYVEAEASLTQGATDAFGHYVNGTINLPIVSGTLALRATGYERRNEGWISSATLGDRTVNGSHVEGGRATLRWDASTRWSISLMGLYQHDSLDGSSFVETNLAGMPYGEEYSQDRIRTPTPASIRSAVVNLAVEGDLGGVKFNSSTSYTNFKRVQISDNTFTSPFSLFVGLVPGTKAVPESFYSQDKAWTQELRLTSDGTGKFSWLVGLFFQDYQLPANRTDTTSGGASVVILDGTLIQKRTNYSAFGEATYRFSPAIEITMGGRYSLTDSTAVQDLSGAALGGANLAGTSKSSSTRFSPKAQLTLHPASKILLYGLVSSGYRPGGPNLQYPGVAVPPTYRDDEVWNYEIGAKTSWLDNKLVLNAAAFIDDFKNLQVVTATAGGLPFLGNAGSARSKGVELELRARPAQNLSFTAALTYTDARFTSDAPLLPAFSGDRIPQIPRWALSGAIDYHVPMNDHLQAFAHLDARSTSTSSAGLGTVYRSNNLQLDGYGMANLRLGISSPKWTLALFAQNLTDTNADLGISAVSPTMLRVQKLRPRTLGINVSSSF